MPWSKWGSECRDIHSARSKKDGYPCSNCRGFNHAQVVGTGNSGLSSWWLVGRSATAPGPKCDWGAGITMYKSKHPIPLSIILLSWFFSLLTAVSEAGLVSICQYYLIPPFITSKISFHIGLSSTKHCCNPPTPSFPLASYQQGRKRQDATHQ